MTRVEELTRQAVHRRDHTHSASGCATPMETVSFGSSYFVACHDCGWDTVLVGREHAHTLAQQHANLCPSRTPRK